MAAFVPKKGDFVALDFDPQPGHEQKGRRPALVLSNEAFNKGTGMAMVCPLTHTDRGFPFHVPVTVGTKLSGFVMVDQFKSVDTHSRQSKSSAGLQRPWLKKCRPFWTPVWAKVRGS